MAPAIKLPKPTKTGTPKGMEGVRPGSPQAIKAGYKPPKAPGKPGGAPFAVSFNADNTTTLKPPTAPTVTAAPPPVPTAAPAPTTPFNYAEAFYADPRYAGGLAGIMQSQLGIGSKYGLRLNRDTDKASPTYGMVMYRKPKIGADGKAVIDEQAGKPVYESTGITAKVNPQTGAMTYSDTTGKAYSVADLELDVVPVARGEEGYLEGALGQAAAQSERTQFGIGDTAARAGVRRSGMTAQAGASETSALQSALRNLSLGAAGEFGGTTTRYADLLNQIYPDLVKQAGAYATPPATPTPAPAPAPAETPAAPSTTPPVLGGTSVPQTPTQQAKSFSIAGQTVTLPKGINLKGVDVESIGRRIAANVAGAGGVKKLKPGQRVGEFRAGAKGYRVFYRGGKFVVEEIG